MPPRTRTRAAKDLKENVVVGKKIKAKSDGRVTKPPRKALADKTNSLSDDNSSIDVPTKSTRSALKLKVEKSVCKIEVRPRRERKLPTRYIENNVLNNLSNSKDTQLSPTAISNLNSKKSDRAKQHVSENVKAKEDQSELKKSEASSRPRRNCRLQPVKEVLASKDPETPNKLSVDESTTLKTPVQCVEVSLVANRPRRISRLPSRFEEHSISPNKFIPLQPCYASTPIVKKQKDKNVDVREGLSTEPKHDSRDIMTKTTKKGQELKKPSTKGIDHYFTKSSKTNKIEKAITTSNSKTSPDTNNNPKGKRTLSKKTVCTKSPTKVTSPKAIKAGSGKRLLEKSFSFRVFEDRKRSDKNDDIYEFTYDPKEEPAPQKKKRKKPVKRKPAKPKTVVYKNNYDDNVAKALESLKSKVKLAQPQSLPKVPAPNLPQPPQSLPKPPSTQPSKTKQDSVPIKTAEKIQIIEDVIIKSATEPIFNHTPANETGKNSVHMSNYASINVDDIAADFESICHNNMNYSPVYSPENSPCHKTPTVPISTGHNIDPLNLQGDASFFDNQPVASSSMNVSARLPIASPWRVEFGNLPIRWQANTYVKANMTPAVDSSFINSEEINRKKHVYTNIVSEPLPQLEEPCLKQTSIISFMRECAEKSNKKKRDRSLPKSNSLFDDSNAFNSPKKARKENDANILNSNKSCDKDNSNDNSNKQCSNNDNENSKENLNQNESPRKKSHKKKDGTFFGFDESVSFDQENVSPIKNIRHTRARVLRPKSRNVLQEVNTVTGPSRAVLPVSAKAKLASSEVVNKLYDQMKSENAQVPEKEKLPDEAITNDPPLNESDDDSVHLFEDIEVIHHLKTHRKSYGKAKKVAFRQRSNDSSESHVPDTRSSSEDDLDLSFQLPDVKQKKVTKKKKPKKQLSKKEEKEVEEWAAGFNSMCEDIDEFPLVVE